DMTTFADICRVVKKSLESRV
ncbi:TPA: acyl carrier protein, partial [Salmonella enterica]|nr:acyl carrier protein [Salmonella enterica]HCL4722791.1 acyl carrier protein [Salmonella enterica]